MNCEPNAAFFGFMGIVFAVVFSNLGGAYGTAKSAVGICSVGVMRPDLIMKSIIPVILAGILGIYGLILSFLLIQSIKSSSTTYSYYQGFSHLAAGVSLGLSCLASGLCIGIVGDAGVRANAQQPRLYVGMLLMLIFAEALALYGLIIGIYIYSSEVKNLCTPYI